VVDLTDFCDRHSLFAPGSLAQKRISRSREAPSQPMGTGFLAGIAHVPEPFPGIANVPAYLILAKV
jgi:hypothetical protein